MRVCRLILKQYVCQSTQNYDCNVEWHGVNVILVSLLQKKGGGVKKKKSIKREGV